MQYHFNGTLLSYLSSLPCTYQTNTMHPLREDFDFFWQYPLLAPSVHCPQMVWGCVCACACGTGIVQNELICWYAKVVHISSSFHPHTHILIPFEDREPTGLKVDIAKKNNVIWSRLVSAVSVLSLHLSGIHCLPIWKISPLWIQTSSSLSSLDRPFLKPR